MTWRFFVQKFDWRLFFVVLALIGLSFATFYHLGPSANDIIERQVILLAIGIVLFGLVAMFDYRIFKNYSAASVILYLASVLLLGVVLFSERIRGVSSWLSVGGFSFEPSELAKLAVIILLAKYFSQKHANIYDFRHIIASGVYVLIPTFLVFIQPDLGSAVVFLMVWVVMLLASGIKRKHFLAIILIGFLVVCVAWIAVLKPYQRTRITTFLDPYLDPRGEGYSLIQSKTTVGSGKIFGVLFQRDSGAQEDDEMPIPVLVPEPYTDFTFSMYAQRFGIVGIVVLMILFSLLIARIRSIVLVANNNFAKLFAIGFFTFIMTHVFINAGMNIGLLPITGIPFSFLSYGGSHLMTLMLGLGIIESIKLHS